MTRLITFARTNKKEFKRFSKFLVVGAIGFVVDFGILNVLYRVFGVDPGIAQAVSFTCAAISNFTWNRFWTYPESRSKPIHLQFGQFFGLSVVGIVVRSIVFTLLKQPMIDLVISAQGGFLGGLINFAVNTLQATLEQLGINAAAMVGVVVVMFWNFFANRFITYSDVKIGH